MDSHGKVIQLGRLPKLTKTQVCGWTSDCYIYLTTLYHCVPVCMGRNIFILICVPVYVNVLKCYYGCNFYIMMAT